MNQGERRDARFALAPAGSARCNRPERRPAFSALRRPATCGDSHSRKPAHTDRYGRSAPWSQRLPGGGLMDAIAVLDSLWPTGTRSQERTSDTRLALQLRHQLSPAWLEDEFWRQRKRVN